MGVYYDSMFNGCDESGGGAQSPTCYILAIGKFTNTYPLKGCASVTCSKLPVYEF